MDKIHDVRSDIHDSKPWISKRKCRITDLHARIESSDLALDPLSALEQVSDEDKDNYNNLTTKLESFAKVGHKEIKPYFMFNSMDERFLVDTAGCPLKMIELQLDHAKRMISDRTYKVEYLMTLKTTRRELLMRQLAMANRDRNTDKKAEEGGETLQNEDLLIEDFKSDRIVTIVVVQLWTQPTKTGKIKLEKEMLFHSKQTLASLRDQFKCQRDYGVPMDLSENPEQQAERVFRCELFKSAYFLIEDTFFNDMRDPNNTDMSASIVNWASEEVQVVGDDGRNCKVGRGIGPFKRERMEQTRFEDITFRLGYPYLYSHQGDCEHLFTISDIRYIPNHDNFRQMRFPFVTATTIGRKEDSLKCYMCQNRPPHWYTRNNSRLPIDPFFFCENCFYSFNYDSDKRKIGQFQAYLYTGTHGIPDSVTLNTNRSV